ncbi:MAG: pyruvate, water dikinase, partial [Microgenomates group bacterium Gr01-1014_93]
GKGAPLGEMTKAGIPVPPGFVVTTETFKKFLDTEIPDEGKEEILKAFDELGAERVAVRSSAVAEDSETASWAGQLESYLNVGRGELIENIRKCWNSIKSERALSYAGQTGVDKQDLSVAVVVQKMVNSEVSGVMFTANPITKNRDEIMIEAGFGLGEMIVQGMITPDNFLVSKDNLEIKSRDIQTQETMLVFKDGQNKEVPVPNGDEPALTDEQIKELAEIGLKIERHYGFPVDVEWAYENGQFYITQSRPITTL